MLTDLTFNELYYICCHLRERDAAEIYGMRPHDNPLQLAYEANHMIRNQGRGKISWHKGRPAAVAAFTESWPGMWEAWMFGTDDFKDALYPLMRWVRTEAKDILDHCQGNRLQCDSRADYEDSHNLIRSLGGKEEVVLRRYGKDGSDYKRFVWINGEGSAVTILQPHYVRDVA